jgi:hypothetical protein
MRPRSAPTPDAAVVKPRRISPRRDGWARGCAWIIGEYGAVTGTRIYPKRHQARWKARYLIELLVLLDIHSRPELCEHTDRNDGGWKWTVEYVPPRYWQPRARPPPRWHRRQPRAYP